MTADANNPHPQSSLLHFHHKTKIDPSLLTHATHKANQLRTTYTQSPPDPYLLEEGNLYIF